MSTTIEKLTNNLLLKNQEIKDLKVKIKALEKEVKQLKAQSIQYGKKEKNVKRKILELRSRGLSTGAIFKALNHQLGINVSLESISRIVDNIYTLDQEDVDYYNDCQAKYKSETKSNIELERQNAIHDIQVLMDSTSSDLVVLEGQEDPELLAQKQKLRRELRELIEAKTKLLQKSSGFTSVSNEFEEIMDDYNKRPDNIVEFKAKAKEV